MWKPTHKQITPKEHGIQWVEYITNPKTRLKIGTMFPTNSIILSFLFNKYFSNIVVCTSFDTNTMEFHEANLKKVLREIDIKAKYGAKHKKSLKLSIQP